MSLACEICGIGVPEGERWCDDCASEADVTLARMLKLPEYGLLASGAPAKRLPVTDDEIIGWWEALDNGLSVAQIAKRERRPVAVVEEHLRDLGVLEPTPTPPKGRPRKSDEERLLERILTDTLTEEESNIAEALARINIPDRDNEIRTVKFARSMQHVKPNARGAVVQSARQRRLDRMAAGWRKTIRADMAKAGLLPRTRPGER